MNRAAIKMKHNLLLPMITIVSSLLIVTLDTALGNSTTTGSTYYHNEEQLLNALFQGYRKDARPVKNFTDTLTVYMDTELVQIIKLDEQAQALDVTMLFNFMWEDEYLKWDITQSNNIDMINAPGTSVWTPYILLLNSPAKQGLEACEAILKERQCQRFWTAQYPVALNYLGYVFSFSLMRQSSTCETILTSFPFDTQTCAMTFSAFMPSKYVRVEDGSFLFSESGSYYRNSSEWRNVTLTVEPWVKTVKTPDGRNVDTGGFTVFITMSRNPTFYVLYVLIPSVLTAYVSVLVFLLPPESGERIGLSITVLLSYTVFLLMVSEFTPRGGNHTPVLIYYIITVETMSAFSLFLTVLVLRLYNRDSAQPVPAVIRCLLCQSPGPRTVIPAKQDGTLPEPEPELEQEVVKVNPWHRVARRLDWLLFWASLVVTSCLTLGMAIVIYNHANDGLLTEKRKAEMQTFN